MVYEVIWTDKAVEVKHATCFTWSKHGRKKKQTYSCPHCKKSWMLFPVIHISVVRAAERITTSGQQY